MNAGDILAVLINVAMVIALIYGSYRYGGVVGLFKRLTHGLQRVVAAIAYGPRPRPAAKPAPALEADPARIAQLEAADAHPWADVIAAGEHRAEHPDDPPLPALADLIALEEPTPVPAPAPTSEPDDTPRCGCSKCDLTSEYRATFHAIARRHNARCQTKKTPPSPKPSPSTTYQHGDPDQDGNVVGDRWFNLVTDQAYCWNGSLWATVKPSLGDYYRTCEHADADITEITAWGTTTTIRSAVSNCDDCRRAYAKRLHAEVTRRIETAPRDERSALLIKKADMQELDGMMREVRAIYNALNERPPTPLWWHFQGRP